MRRRRYQRGASRPPQTLGDLLAGVLPPRVAQQAPPPGLLAAWREAVGPALAARSWPVCRRESGELVVSVDGAAWRQELKMAEPELLARLAEGGYPALRLKLVQPRHLPPPPPPPPPARTLSPAEEQGLEDMVARVADPQLRRALLAALRAQARRGPA
ncbi:MAG: DUF721 domain-containing protein [Deltaproteobacteria bacterium]|nr:DUF721 domain-containing protein [Deltaproteobacteria bacterium]